MAARAPLPVQAAVLMMVTLTDFLMMPVLMAAYKWLLMGRISAGSHAIFSSGYTLWLMGSHVVALIAQNGLVSFWLVVAYIN